MPMPQFDDLIEDSEEVYLSEPETRTVLVRLDRARTVAAYWQGKYEDAQRLIDSLNDQVADLVANRDITICYLKDRLDRAEVPRPVVATGPAT